MDNELYKETLNNNFKLKHCAIVLNNGHMVLTGGQDSAGKTGEALNTGKLAVQYSLYTVQYVHSSFVGNLSIIERNSRVSFFGVYSFVLLQKTKRECINVKKPHEIVFLNKNIGIFKTV